MNLQQVKIVVIGAGNRTNKYLEYAVRHPERLKLVGIVEPVEIRRRLVANKFGVPEDACFSSFDDFFANPIDADAVLIGTPEDKHYEPDITFFWRSLSLRLSRSVSTSWRHPSARELS